MTHPSIHAKASPDKIAYLMADTGEALTYAQLDAASNSGAHVFRALGLGPQDHIAILMENSLRFLEICWAAQRCGLYYTAISTYLTPKEAAYIVEDCGAKVFISSEAMAHSAAEASAGLPLEVARFMTGKPLHGWRSWDEAVTAQPTTPIADEIAGYDMLYSSGTTGRPKGVLPPFKNEPVTTLSPLLMLLCGQMCGMSEDSIYLSPAPLYHAAPLRFNMTSAALGGTSIIMRKFDPEEYLRLVEHHRATATQLVPSMFVLLLKLPEDTRRKYDVSSLKGAVHAAAPCPVEVKKQMIDWWGPILIEYYGGTEGNGITLVTSADWLAHPGTVGRSLVGDVKILDPAGEELKPGETGAIYFAGGPEFAYYKDPEKTKGVYIRPGVSTLGDIGYLDADGYLYLTDRKAYMIISGGVNVYPQEAENVLITHPAVMDVAVFGVPNEVMGEEVKAVVQPVAGIEAGPTLAEQLMVYCRSQLSPVKCPRSIDFRDELPRTPTGKLLKRLLKDAYWHKDAAITAPASS